MKAAVHTRYGPPEVVRIQEVDRPAVGDRDVLIRVYATTVNRTDCAYRAAKPFFMRLLTGLTRPRRTIMGTEFAGAVEAVGRDVTSFAVGERVFGYSERAFGAHAEYLSVPQDGSIATVPAGVTFEQIAPATEGAHYALACIRHAGTRAGHDVLVYGATGGIGSAAVQLLKSLGVTVTAVGATENLALVRGFGRRPGRRLHRRRLHRGRADYDAVYDAVGRSTFGRCRRLLKPGGVYLSSELGPWAQNPMLALVTPLLRGRKVKFPFPRDDQAIVRHLRELIESGKFKPVTDRRYPLDQIVDAYRYVETGQKIGNVVITVTPESSGSPES